MKRSASRRPFARRLLRVAAALLVTLLLAMRIEASIVRLQVAELPLKDLPAAFEGTRILYLSDLHIGALNSEQKVRALMEQLARLEPDLLLLGGDYTSFDPFLRLRSGADSARARERELRDLFFASLADIQAPLGKFAVAGEEDNLLERGARASLADAMALGGVTLLRDEAARVTRGTDTLVIAGTDDWRSGMQDTRSLPARIGSGECVILLCHNPEAVPVLNRQMGADGGPWIDVALCGHTHGGVIALGGRELLNPLGDEALFRRGWHREGEAKMLISNGVSNELLPLRFRTPPQAHVITLTRGN